MDKLLQICKEGGPIYTFEKSWSKPGGVLFGENFITDICMHGEIQRSSVRVQNVDNVYICASNKSDPDFIFYLWKKGHGDKFDFYITENEILFLYEFYRANGFDCMQADIISASERLNKKYSFCITL